MTHPWMMSGKLDDLAGEVMDTEYRAKKEAKLSGNLKKILAKWRTEIQVYTDADEEQTQELVDQAVLRNDLAPGEIKKLTNHANPVSGLTTIAAAVKRGRRFYFNALLPFANEMSIDQCLYEAILLGDLPVINKILESGRFSKEDASKVANDLSNRSKIHGHYQLPGIKEEPLTSPESVQTNQEEFSFRTNSRSEEFECEEVAKTSNNEGGTYVVIDDDRILPEEAAACEQMDHSVLKDLNNHDFMVAACRKAENKSQVVSLLYKHGFRIDKNFAEKAFPAIDDRATEYYYAKHIELAASCEPIYIILQAEEQRKIAENLDTLSIFSDNDNKKSRSDREKITDDNTIFKIIIELIHRIRAANEDAEMYRADYDEMENRLQDFFVKLLEQSRNDGEHAKLLKLDKFYNDRTKFYDREYVPLLKQLTDMELKQCATCKPFQGMMRYLFHRYLEYWPKGVLGDVLMFVIGMFYPLLVIAFLFAPNSYLGKFSHYPRVSYYCEAASEIYYLTLILIYPYVVYNQRGYLIYNIILTVFALAKSGKELQEIHRRSWVFYSKDLYNIIDWSEIICLIIVIVCRYVVNPYTDDYWSRVKKESVKSTSKVFHQFLFPTFFSMRP